MSHCTTASIIAFCPNTSSWKLKLHLFQNQKCMGYVLWLGNFHDTLLNNTLEKWFDYSFYWDVLLLPVTWVALARVKIKALLSSSDSAERTVLGSLRNRVNCGWTSELPKAVISLRAVLSTLKEGNSPVSK